MSDILQLLESKRHSESYRHHRLIIFCSVIFILGIKSSLCIEAPSNEAIYVPGLGNFFAPASFSGPMTVVGPIKGNTNGNKISGMFHVNNQSTPTRISIQGYFILNGPIEVLGSVNAECIPKIITDPVPPTPASPPPVIKYVMIGPDPTIPNKLKVFYDAMSNLEESYSKIEQITSKNELYQCRKRQYALIALIYQYQKLETYYISFELSHPYNKNNYSFTLIILRWFTLLGKIKHDSTVYLLACTLAVTKGISKIGLLPYRTVYQTLVRAGLRYR